MTHNFSVRNDSSFDDQRREKKGGINVGTNPDNVPQFLCAHELPTFLGEFGALGKKFPVERIPMSKADVSNAFQHVRVYPYQAHNVCYTVGDVVVIDFLNILRVFGTDGFLGRHFGRGRTRALQHHSECDSAFRRR